MTENEGFSSQGISDTIINTENYESIKKHDVELSNIKNEIIKQHFKTRRL